MTTHHPDSCLDCNPGAAHLGDTLTVQPREWTPLDDNGTQICVYGDQPVDVAVQPADISNQIRAAVVAEQLRIRDLLAGPFLSVLRCVPDGQHRNGCVVQDGQAVREKARTAFLAAFGGDQDAGR